MLVPPTSNIFPQFSAWLLHHIPAWVASHAKYLGFEIGPTAGAAQWSKVLICFNHHLSAITSCGAPPSVNTGGSKSSNRS